MGLRTGLGRAVVSAAIVLTGLPLLATTPERDAVGFVALEPGRIIVPALVDGAGPFRFLLDTGASGTVISDDLARRLGTRAVAKAPLTTSVGTVVRPVVQFNLIQVGSVGVAQLLVVAVPELSQVTGAGTDGILGQDFLSHFNYTIDFKHRQVIWNDTLPAQAGVRLPLNKSHDRFIINLPQDDGRGTVAFVPDSGADALIVFATDIGGLDLHDGGARYRLDSLAGARGGRAVTISKLNVGGVVLRNQPAVEVTAPPDGVERGNGLLPLSLFGRVSFNHTEGYVIIERR